MNFLHVLTLIFVVAKFAGLIAWSWWLVLLPTIISFAFGLAMLLVVFVIAAYAAAKS